METDGVISFFERSIENRNLIYKTYIGDGDSKANSTAQKSMPYGPLVFIKKEECKAHITKRMGTGLRTIVRNFKDNI